MIEYPASLKSRIPEQHWLHDSVVDMLLFIRLATFAGAIAGVQERHLSSVVLLRLFIGNQQSPGVMFPAILVLIVFMVNYVHRHLTFVLVYGDREEFDSHKVTYLVLPLLLAIVTVGFVYFNVFAVLLTLSVMWTMYHSVAQKYGLTRIYSRKANYGVSWLLTELSFLAGLHTLFLRWQTRRKILYRTSAPGGQYLST